MTLERGTSLATVPPATTMRPSMATTTAWERGPGRLATAVQELGWAGSQTNTSDVVEESSAVDWPPTA